MTDRILPILLVAFGVSFGILVFTVSELWIPPQFLVSISVPICGFSLVGYLFLERVLKQ